MNVSHRGRGRGFTLIEVLIALVIVGIGLVGLLSLLSTSLKESSTIVEDSFAATLARSVYDSVRESAHKRAFMVKNSTNGAFVKGFVFLHDGVSESETDLTTGPPRIPATFEGADVDAKLPDLVKSDFTIFLPNAPAGGQTGPNAGEDVFVYPRPGGAQTDNSPPPGKSNFIATGQPQGYAGQLIYFDVKRTYELKRRTPVQVAQATDFYAAPPELADQYSFALLFRRAVEPVLTQNDDGKTPIAWTSDLTGTFPPRGLTNQSTGIATDGLYQVEIWVYRNFEKDPVSRLHEPVRGGRLLGLLALGP